MIKNTRLKVGGNVLPNPDARCPRINCPSVECSSKLCIILFTLRTFNAASVLRRSKSNRRHGRPPSRHFPLRRKCHQYFFKENGFHYLRLAEPRNPSTLYHLQLILVSSQGLFRNHNTSLDKKQIYMLIQGLRFNEFRQPPVYPRFLISAKCLRLGARTA